MTKAEILERLTEIYRKYNKTTKPEDYMANRKFATDYLILELLCDIRDKLENSDIIKVNKEPTIKRKK
jgi:hypothetical protein